MPRPAYRSLHAPKPSPLQSKKRKESEKIWLHLQKHLKKFSTWRKSKTPLKVTIIVGGKTEEVTRGVIAGLDSDGLMLSLVDPETRLSTPAITVEDADFSVESNRVVATRNASDWIVFEAT